jgi:hypothetical protein
MKITINKSEITMAIGVAKTIFTKVVSELELPTGVDAADFDVTLEQMFAQERIETATAIVTAVDDVLTIEIKEQFLNDYLTLLADVANDAIVFTVANKEVLTAISKRLTGYFMKNVQKVVKRHLQPIMEPSKEFFATIKKKFEAFGEKLYS